MNLRLSLYAYWQFLKQPRLLKIGKDKGTLWQDFLLLLMLDFLFALILGIVHGTLLHYKLVKEYATFDYFKAFGFWGTYALAVIAAPLLEEAIFRWQLRKRLFSIYFVMISTGLVAASFTKSDHSKFFILISFLVIAVALHMVMSKRGPGKGLAVWRKYYVFLFYFTAIIFGYIHYTNIKGLTITDPSFIFYVASQIFTGLSLGYLRVKYGLGYSILFHASFNAIALTLVWFLTSKP